MKQNYSVYLAGPISGLSYEESIRWRQEAIEAFKGTPISCYSPMRAKTYLKGMVDLPKTNVSLKPLSTARGIMVRDHRDCTTCDLVLVNFLGQTGPNAKASLGTAMELAWCYEKHIPTVVVMEPEGNIHEHMMIQEATGYRVTTLAEAYDIVKAILLPMTHG